MQNLKIDPGAWIAVCDGGKALILKNIGDATHPNFQTLHVFEITNPATSEQGTERPGRAHSSVGPGRSAVRQTDWHEQAEEKFLADLAGRLHAAIHAGQTKSLIIVAPPSALGILREHYTPALKQALQQEVDKDLVMMPVDQIEKHLAA